MAKYFIVPGLGNSGAGHWQTWMENSNDDFTRINQLDWDAPSREDWVSQIENTLAGADHENLILIGHSLGCATIVHWAATHGKIIKGALLVAPSDVEAAHYNFPATGFAPMPLQKIPFKTIVVASSNDPWVTIERAEFFAEQWGSGFVNLGPAGHINADSGHNEWAAGMALLKTL